MSCPKIFTISLVYTFGFQLEGKEKKEKEVKVHIESPTMNQCFA
jgi:hypothetical protein